MKFPTINFNSKKYLVTNLNMIPYCSFLRLKTNNFNNWRKK